MNRSLSAAFAGFALAISSVALSGGQQPPPAAPFKLTEEAVETDADRVPAVRTSGDCLLRGGTLLTVTHGTQPETDLLIRGGKIAQIGKGLRAPAGVPVIDVAGKFLTPGIVDAHSHIAEDETNEYTDSITPEVRIHDVLNPSSLGIYQKLASGFTASLVLHGSSNPIGGQSVVIKHKWKRPASELPVPDAPRIIKFALGENVKQSNPFPGQTSRFPATRMGVEAVYRRAFTEARRYMDEWDRYRKSALAGNPGAPPRRDLRLETLADILRRQIWVHCHSYRADEMLMMLRLSKEFGFKLAALQHALEAYKIRPEIREAGVGVSTFADFWAYKVEAYDAIPHNAALCARAGIVTSVNTDTGGGVTLLNLDAAKAMKFGGLSETEALKLITLNPAIQLGIDRRCGSLDVGKDGDIAVWDGHPFNVYSRCAMTLVEGQVYFQRRDAFNLNSQAAVSTSVPIPVAAGQLAAPEARTYAVAGATVHPISGPDIPNGTVVVENGRIAAVGARAAIPRGAVVINGRGLHLYPGLIDAGSTLGISEIDQVQATVDTTESGRFQPDLLALTAVNPASELIPVARAEGVTNALVRPAPSGEFGGGPLIGGQSALIHLAGWTPDQMKAANPVALHIRFPDDNLPPFLQESLPPAEVKKRQNQQRDQVRLLREYLERAKRYAASRAARPAETPPDAPLEAMVPYVTGKAPVVIHVNSIKGIRQAIDMALELGLRPILSDAGNAWRIGGWLAERKVPVICHVPVMEIADGFGSHASFDPYDAGFAAPALLHRAGVKVCLESGSASQVKGLGAQAGVAAAFGLPRAEAMKAVTLNAAEILGVSDALGSITVGKTANLILTDGDPLEVTTSVRLLLINGRPIPLESRHTRLYKLYRARR